MGADRKGPLAAFIVVAIVAAILLVTSVRSQAAPGWFRDPASTMADVPSSPYDVWPPAPGSDAQVLEEGVQLLLRADPDASDGATDSSADSDGSGDSTDSTSSAADAAAGTSTQTVSATTASSTSATHTARTSRTTRAIRPATHRATGHRVPVVTSPAAGFGHPHSAEVGSQGHGHAFGHDSRSDRHGRSHGEGHGHGHGQGHGHGRGHDHGEGHDHGLHLGWSF